MQFMIPFRIYLFFIIINVCDLLTSAESCIIL